MGASTRISDSARKEVPSYILFAGVNGAGKSTLFRSGMWENGVSAAELPRVNPDEILVAHGWDWSDPTAQLRAGKEAVRLIKGHVSAGRSFNQETTLSGRSAMQNIKRAKGAGYRIIVHYVGVENPFVANERIAHRADIGGHSIAEETVRRRWSHSLENLVSVEPLCDKILLYDNTAILRLVARIEQHDLSFYDPSAPGITWPSRLFERLIANKPSRLSQGNMS